MQSDAVHNTVGIKAVEICGPDQILLHTDIIRWVTITKTIYAKKTRHFEGMEFCRTTLVISLVMFACVGSPQARTLPKVRVLGSGNDDTDVSSGAGDTTPVPQTTQPPSSSPQSSVIACGTRGTHGRIVGGKKAPLGAWPWQVGIKSCPDCYVECGGTIVGKKWVVSAAHCFEDMKPLRPDTLYIDAGVVDQDSGSKYIQTFRCKKIHMHNDYDIAERFDFDVALLELDREVVYNDYVRPLCLNDKELNVGQDCTVTGFGTTKNNDFSVYLKQATVPIVSKDICTQTYDDGITENMMCAGYSQGGTDSCQGDSGGPLTCYNAAKQRYVLGGITSWGGGCAKADLYGVYTNVTRVASWVRKMTGNTI